MEVLNFNKNRLSQLISHGLIISGRGGSKGGGSARTPVEANDTVNSRAMASVLDLLGEGVIGGLVDGAKSIFLNDTPLQNSDNSYNFSGVTWWFRDGSQDQSVIEGFDFIETPKSIGRQLKQTSQVNVSLDSADSDRVRVVMKFPSLRSINKKSGDTNGTTVQFKFQIDAGNGKGFVDVVAEGESGAVISLTAKKTGVYYRSYVIDLPKPATAYTLRAIRLTEDHADNSYLYDDTYVDSIGEIVNTSLNYPNSALVGLKINSEQFGSTMPSRSYLIKGLKIRVPSNYNADTNSYDGNWDGTFKLASSSNPAWILFDLLTNTRYGLGQFVQESMINIGELYQIGRYCDATVDDGFGGKEKRFAINTQITSRQDAYRVVQDIAGAFRGMVYWAGGMVHVTQDSPSDPVMLFSNSNVVNGAFAYKGSARKDRYSVALITYNNKEDGYKQSVEYVEDQEAIKRYGIRKTESVAFGCTSRGQAHRVGLWTLYTSRMESDVITFAVGMDSVFLMPGDIVLIADKFRAGRRNSGRITGYTSNSIKLDAPVDLTSVGNHITFLSAEGKMVGRDILENGKNITTVTFKTALSSNETPVNDAVWVIAQPDLTPLQARVVSVAEGDDGTSFNITAIQNNPTKYEAIDSGAQLIPQNTTVLDPTFSKPSGLAITEGTYLSSPGNLSVSLTATWQGKSSQYYISWRRSDAGNVSNWKSERVTEEQFELRDVAEKGQYDFQVYAVSVGGRKTDPISITYKVLGTMTAPDAPTGLTAAGDYRSIILNWINPTSVDLDHIEVLASKVNDKAKAQLIAKVSGTTFTHNGLEDSVTWYYWVRAANKRGMLSALNSPLATTATTRDVLSFLQNKITESELGQDLLGDIDSKAIGTEVDAAIDAAKKEAASKINDAREEASNALSEVQKDLNSAISKEALDRANAIADEASARAAAITDTVAVEAKNRTKAIADSVSSLTAKIAEEATTRASSITKLDTKTAEAISDETSSRIAAIESEALARADGLLEEKNNRQSEIQNLSTQMQTANESLAQQISQIAAGTGEQFDSLNIWYFDTDNEGWTEDDNGYTPMNVTSDGWLKAVNSTATCRSPNNLVIDANAYRFIKLRIKKVGAPVWAGKLLWIGSSESGWSTDRSIDIDEPEYDSNGIATLSIHDIDWRASTAIRRFRFDFLKSQDEDNYVLIDWIAVGRPTPGAGMAALQAEQTARVNADAAEAANRNTLAVQMRGSYEGNDLSKVGSGLIFQEQQARITADKAEATARQSLETKVNDSVSNINKSLDTLNTQDKAIASDITGLQSSLKNKADTSALQTLQTSVDQQGANLSTQGQSITQLQNDLNTTNANIGKKADQTALAALQGTVVQQGKDITAANSSITNLKSSLETTNSNVSKKADATAVNDLTSRVSATEGKVSSQADSIVKLNNSLNNVIADSDASVKTPNNLIVNPSFERGTEGYIGVSDKSTAVVVQTPHSGTRALKIDLGSVAPGQNIDFVKDRTYEIGVWVKQIAGTTDNGSGNNKLRVGSSAGNPVFELPFVGVSADWAKFSKRWKATETASLPVTLNNYLTAGERYFDDFYVIDVTDSVKIDANSSALSSIQNTVTQQGKDIASQSSSITDLKNGLNSTNANVSKKADAEALQALQNTVTQQGKDLASTNQAITSLKGRVSTVEDGLSKTASADAVNNLGTRVTNSEGKLNTTAQQTTALKSQITTGNLLLNGDLINGADNWQLSGAGAGAPVYDSAMKGLTTADPAMRIANETKIPVEAGQSLTLTFGFKTDDATISIGTQNFTMGLIENWGNPTNWLAQDNTWFAGVTTGYQTRTLTFTIPNDFKGRWCYLRMACGGWTPSTARVYLQGFMLTASNGIAGKADASAVQDLQSQVTKNGDDIATNASAITSLGGRIDATNAEVAKKATTAALDSLKATVTQQGKDIAANVAATTSLSADLSAMKQDADNKLAGNLIPNGGFERGLDNWVTGSTTDVRVDTAQQPSSGKKILYFKAHNDQLDEVRNTTTVTVVAGRTYKFGGFARAKDGTTIVTGTEQSNKFRFAFSDNTQIQEARIDPTKLQTGSVWTEVYAEWKANKSGDMQMSIMARLSSGELYVDDMFVIDITDQKNIDANATALNNLQTTVSQQGDKITSQGASLTQLSGRVDTVNADLGKRIDQKADSSTVQNLSATVTQQGKDVTTANQAITGLKGRVTTVEDGLAKAATADAVSNLDTRVTNAEGKIESQGTAITGINVTLNSQTATGGDYILNPTFDPAYSSMGFTRRDTIDNSDDDSIPFDADIPAGAPRRYVARLASRDHQLNTPPWPVKAGQVFEISVWVAAKAGSVAAFNMYIGSATSPSTGAVAYTALTGSVAPTQTWTEKKYRWTVPSNFPRGYMRPFLQVNQNAPFGSVWYATDFHCREITAAQGAQTAADAAAGAVTQLDAKVTQQGSAITSQGQSIAAITGRVSSLESGQSTNSSAIQSLKQRTTAAEGKIETNSQAITSVTGAVNAMLNRGENLANDFNFMSGSALWGVQGNTRNKVEFGGDFGDGKPGVQMTQIDSTLYTGLFANQKTPLPHNTPRRYQVIVKAKGVSGAMNFMVRRFNYQGNVAGTYENRQFSATDTWATYAAEFSAPSSATVDGSVFALYCYPNASVIQIDYIAIYDITDAVAIDANTSAVTQLQQTVTQQGKDIAANASATTAVSASLNAAMADVDNKITGNLILNGGFERDFTNWTAPAPTTIMAASSPHSGKKIVKYVAATSATLLSSDTVITVVKGRTYKFGAWLRAKAGSTMQPNMQPNNKVRFAYLDSSVIVEARFDPATMPTGSVWQEYSNTWTATKDGTMSVSINAFLNAGEIYIDDVYVIDITDRVDLDATAGAISNLQSTVTEQGKNIASNASAITSVNASIGTLQSQGLNPWCDGSFESYAPNQQLYSSVAVVSTDVSRNGNKSLRITRKDGEAGNSDKYLGKWLSVRGGGKYRFSFWAYMASDMTAPNAWNVGVGLYARGENGGANQWPEAVRISATNVTPGKWVFLTGVASVAADRSIAQMWIATRGPIGGTGYSLYLDDISIVDVTDAQEAQDTATGAANAVTQLTATVTQQGEDITAQTTKISSLESKVDNASSKVDQLSQTLTDSHSTQASLNTSLQSQIDAQASANIKNQTELNSAATSIASIKSTQSTQATQISAISKTQTDMTATLNNQTASIQTLQEAVSNNDALNSTWMVKMETNSNGQKYAAGIALGVDGKNMQSQFLVQADRFALINTSNGNTTTPFVIDNGVTYMNAAYIKDGSITNAKVGDLQSSNFSSGRSGWRISKNGTMEINGSGDGSARTTISNGKIEVYDSNNRLRVRMGIF